MFRIGSTQMNVSSRVVGIALLYAFFGLMCCTGNGRKGRSNRLADETSAYLLQHARNPVDWYPWGTEALKRAEEEGKLLIISIGYTACHWCHVMERETFEDPEVAAFMNRYFISVKVDREERPDIDQVYMSAVQLITGNGGWPLHAFALPDGRPFYGGTYYGREEWLKLLHQLVELHKEDFDRLKESAGHIAQGIRDSELIPLQTSATAFDKKGYGALFDTCIGRLDRRSGGLDREEKFPLPSVWEFLLQYQYLTGKTEALREVHLTLENMAFGGIFDQIGGGFSRYATDRHWRFPHFEKMLYDNAQLVSLYAQAYQASGNQLYKDVLIRTLAFVEDELSSPEGGFYASLDAESEGEEGRYYVWSMDDCRSLLSKQELDLTTIYYHLSEEGNWEDGKNILYRTGDDASVANAAGLSEETFSGHMALIQSKLLAQRRARVRPRPDTKVLTSWNALMLSGYTAAYRALGDRGYLEVARSTARFILGELRGSDGGLRRSAGKGKSSMPAFLDDYAYTIRALVQLYQVTFEETWLNEAEQLCIYVDKHFSDRESRMFFYSTVQSDPVIVRRTETVDQVLPASNSVMAQNLYILGNLFDREEWRLRAAQMLNNVLDRVVQDPLFYAQWAVLWGWFAWGHYEVAILGADALNIRAGMDLRYRPDVFYIGGQKEGRLPLLENKWQPGRTMIYVCRDRVCRLPVEKAEDALAQLK